MVHIKKNGGQVGKEYALEVKLLHFAHIHSSLVMGGQHCGGGRGMGWGGSCYRKDFLQLCAIFHQQDVHFGVSNDMFTGVRGAGGINTNTEAPGKRKHTHVCAHIPESRTSWKGRKGSGGRVCRQVLSLKSCHQLPSLHNWTMTKRTGMTAMMDS